MPNRSVPMKRVQTKICKNETTEMNKHYMRKENTKLYFMASFREGLCWDFSQVVSYNCLFF